MTSNVRLTGGDFEFSCMLIGDITGLVLEHTYFFHVPRADATQEFRLGQDGDHYSVVTVSEEEGYLIQRWEAVDRTATPGSSCTHFVLQWPQGVMDLNSVIVREVCESASVRYGVQEGAYLLQREVLQRLGQWHRPSDSELHAYDVFPEARPAGM